MQRHVFYSWQSDLPNATNRSFIQRALETTAKRIASEKELDIQPVIDRDTEGVAGAPDIGRTIFGKISSADIFVADISIIARSPNGRPTPNPNVLVELGYAMNSLGEDRLILIFNLAHGRLEDLPFDLRTRRAVTYTMAEATDDRAIERRSLENRLDTAIRAALSALETKSAEPAPNFSPLLAKHREWVIPKLESVPEFGRASIYCLPFRAVNISISELQEFATKHRMELAEELQHYPQVEPLQAGISLGYYPRGLRPTIKSTVRATLYRDGVVAFDALADLDMGRATSEVGKSLNIYWLSYEVQRHIQLAKAVLSPHGVQRIRIILELANIEEVSLVVAGSRGLGMHRHPYTGNHEPVVREVDLREVHDLCGPERNNVIPIVRDMVDEVARVFDLMKAPSDIADAAGALAYVTRAASGR